MKNEIIILNLKRWQMRRTATWRTPASRQLSFASIDPQCSRMHQSRSIEFQHKVTGGEKVRILVLIFDRDRLYVAFFRKRATYINCIWIPATPMIGQCCVTQFRESLSRWRPREKQAKLNVTYCRYFYVFPGFLTLKCCLFVSCPNNRNWAFGASTTSCQFSHVF